MLVRNQDAIQVFRSAPDTQEPSADLPSAQACIDQETGFACFQESAITTGPASQDSELDGHVAEAKAGRQTEQSLSVERGFYVQNPFCQARN